MRRRLFAWSASRARVVRRDIPCGRVPSWIASSATTTTGGQRSSAVEANGAFRDPYSLLVPPNIRRRVLVWRSPRAVRTSHRHHVILGLERFGDLQLGLR